MKGILFGGIFHSVLALSFGFSSYSAMALDSKNFKKRPKVIYGQDDRMEAYQVSAPGLVTAMNATVAMIPTANLTLKENLFEISQSTLGESMELCKEEPFYNQPTAANCTGFLVGPDLVATAGHCVNEFNCSFQSFVFNYRMQDQNVPPTNLAQNDVYSCKEVVARGYSRNQDYALVRLDRTVVDREPVKLSSQAPIPGEFLVLMGHPSGLPLKVAGNAHVRKIEDGFFVATTDSYGGNSGSPVFKANTLEVAGILVRGDQDYDFDYAKQCVASKVCEEDKCRGEDITLIEFIQKALAQQTQTPVTNTPQQP